MGKEVSFKNRDRIIQLGITIATIRKIRGMSQEELSGKAGISRTHLSKIEAKGTATGFTMEAFFNIADALDVDPAELLRASVLPDNILNSKK